MAKKIRALSKNGPAPKAAPAPKMSTPVAKPAAARRAGVKRLPTGTGIKDIRTREKALGLKPQSNTKLKKKAQGERGITQRNMRIEKGFQKLNAASEAGKLTRKQYANGYRKLQILRLKAGQMSKTAASGAG